MALNVAGPGSHFTGSIRSIKYLPPRSSILKREKEMKSPRSCGVADRAPPSGVPLPPPRGLGGREGEQQVDRGKFLLLQPGRASRALGIPGAPGPPSSSRLRVCTGM